MSTREMIEQIIINVNALVDARGAEKCRLVLDTLSRLAVLRDSCVEPDKKED